MGLFDGLFGAFSAGQHYRAHPEHWEPEHEGTPFDPDDQMQASEEQMAKMAMLQAQAGLAQQMPNPWGGGPVSGPHYSPVWQVGPPIKDARAERLATRRAERRAARRAIGRR